MEDKITRLSKRLPPQELQQTIKEVIDHLNDIGLEEFRRRYRSTVESNSKIVGRGLPPFSVTLGGLFSICGFIYSIVLFDTVRTVVTSPEAESGVRGFELSRSVLDAVSGYLDIVTIPFNEVPKYEHSRRLLELLKRGAIILNGITPELGIWFGRNGGILRLVICRPENDVMVFRYV